MHLVWVLPLAVVVAGLGILAYLLRAIDDAGDDLARQLRELGEVRRAVAVVRAETTRTAATRDDLHRR